MSTVRFDAHLIRRHGGRGPRYTSYPTALQFSDDVLADDYCANARASNDSGLPLSLYVHIPFCHTLCYYCGCHKIVTRNQPRVARYLGALHEEVELQSTLFASERNVEQLHFGGGTPTYLSPSQLEALMAQLRDCFHFDDSGSQEFSIEVDPRSVDGERIRELSALGFNRLSLGIQDFDPAVQQAVNRVQTPEQVSELLSAARRSEFASVSFDLIYGLPHQSVDSFSKTLSRVIDMRPDRIAVYNYAHLPGRFKGQRLIADADIPVPETKLEILRSTIETLCCAGYDYIGMDHFALPDDELAVARRNGTLQRNFQGYSTHRHCDLVSLGVSAISHIGDLFAQNAVSTHEYETLVANGELPIKKGLRVNADDRIRADVIQALMCYDELSFSRFEERHDIEFDAYFGTELAHLESLASDGLITLEPDRLRITAAGRLLLRSIAMVFDRYIDRGATDNRFSKAI